MHISSYQHSLHVADSPEKQAAHDKAYAKARKTAENMESLFISQMLEHMFTDMEVDPLFGGGHAEETYRSMLTDEYGKLMARAGGIGIADHVTRQILQLQEME